MPAIAPSAKSNPQRNLLDIERDPVAVAKFKEPNQMTTPRKPHSVAGSNPLSGSEWTAINQSARQNLPTIVQQLLPGGKVIGKEYIVRNPKRDDKTRRQLQDLHFGPEGRRLERLRRPTSRAVTRSVSSLT